MEVVYEHGADLTGWADTATPGSHLFLICKNGEEHRGEIQLRRMNLEIRDCIRWFHDKTHLSVVIARKPLEGTVANNVLKYGTGGINIDACRIPTEEILKDKIHKNPYMGVADGYQRKNKSSYTHKTNWSLNEGETPCQCRSRRRHHHGVVSAHEERSWDHQEEILCLG